MGVDLIGHGGASFDWETWRSCFELALTFGWHPAGTLAPTDYHGDWDGAYFSNDLQEVTDDDARALAAALYQAVTKLRKGQGLAEELAKACDGKDVALVRKLADYAVQGRFAIL